MTDIHDRPAQPESPATPEQRASSAGPAAASPDPVPDADPIPRGCTAAQLRRFIKSRPYIPLHELRRRFELGGESDDVSSLDTADGVTYVGLPPREGALIQELVRQGEIGVELSMDPDVRIVIGVYPIRPIPRP